MYNNYPNSFKENCAKKMECDNSSKTCKNSSVYIKKELNKLKKSNDNKNNSKTQCIEYSNPKKEIKENIINFDILSNHTWSNQRGYGNIMLGSNDNCNNLNNKIYNWNRIPKQNNPYSTPANVDMAWAKYS